MVLYIDNKKLNKNLLESSFISLQKLVSKKLRTMKKNAIYGLLFISFILFTSVDKV